MAVDVPVLGTPNAGLTGATSYTWPSPHQPDDVLVLATETNVTGGLTPPTGMVHTPESPRAQGVNVTTISAFWKRAISNAESAASVPGTSDHQVGIPFMIRNCRPRGFPWDKAYSTGQTGGTTGRTFGSGQTTLTPNSLILYMVTCNLDTATDSFTNINNPAGLTGFTVLDQNFTTNGNGGGIMVAYGFKATVGALAALTWDFSVAATWSGILLMLPPGSFLGWGVPL